MVDSATSNGDTPNEATLNTRSDDKNNAESSDEITNPDGTAESSTNGVSSQASELADELAATSTSQNVTNADDSEVTTSKSEENNEENNNI